MLKDCLTFIFLSIPIQTDVIVNSTSQSLRLDQGQSSKAVLRAAGNAIQQELDGKYPDGLDPGSVAHSKPGNLNCQCIFHISVPKYTGKHSLKVY